MTFQERLDKLAAFNNHPVTCPLHGDCKICDAYYRILMTPTTDGPPQRPASQPAHA